MVCAKGADKTCFFCRVTSHSEGGRLVMSITASRGALQCLSVRIMSEDLYGSCCANMIALIMLLKNGV